MPNMVKNERSLWAQRARKVCPTISRIRRTLLDDYAGLLYGAVDPIVPGQSPVIGRAKP
jgi:hypothetical protein